MDFTSIINFWSTCRPFYAHLDIHNRDFSEYRKVMRHVDLEDKTVIDYGCGGGWLGLYMLTERKIKKYIAIDISIRSLKTVRNNLRAFRERIITKLPTKHYKNFKADLFVSLACIQHFPSLKYLKGLMTLLNDSGIPEIILQVRYDRESRASNNYDKEGGDVGLCCYTNVGFISEFLPNYELHHYTKARPGHYQYGYWRIKSEV